MPQANLGNRTVGVLMGKVVGGSSAVNAMMTVRGTAEDYDRWGAFFGNESTGEWSWDGLLPYFKRAMAFQTPRRRRGRGANLTFDAAGRYWGPPASATSANENGTAALPPGAVGAGWPSFQYPATKAQVDAYRELPGVEFPPDSGAGRPGRLLVPVVHGPGRRPPVVRTHGPLRRRRRRPAPTTTCSPAPA